MSKLNCYRFPLELLTSLDIRLNLNEWKLLNAFYYLKSRAARAGSETVEISLRMLESDFGIQKISGKNLNCSTFIDTIPEKPVDNNRLLFRSSFLEDTRSFLIPDHYIAPPFPWIERWKKKKIRLRRRMSNLKYCLLFAAMLASRNSAGSADRVSVIQCQDLFRLSGFSMNMRALCDYLNFLKTEGVLTAFEPKKKQITVHWSLEEYGSLTGFSQDYRLSPPEEYSTSGKNLQKALTRVLNQCSWKADPEGAFSKFPFPEFLWLLQHLNPGFTRMIRKSSPLIDEYTKGVQQYDKDLMRTFLVAKGIERELADLITIDFDSLSLFKTGGRKTVEKKLSYLLKRCGLNFDVHREVIVAGPYASDARKKSSRKFSFSDATSLFMLPSFEEFAAQKPYRITINVLNRSLSCPTALTGQVIHTSNDSSSFRPALFVPLLQSGEVFFRVKCSKEVEHLRLSLWILAPAESLKPSGTTDS